MDRYTITIQFDTYAEISNEQTTMFTNAMCTLARNIFRGVNVKDGHMKIELGEPDQTLPEDCSYYPEYLKCMRAKGDQNGRLQRL